MDNLSRKLLAYALNRSLQLSDESIVERMDAKLAANEYRFDSLVETIVTSPQFLNKRNPDSPESPNSNPGKVIKMSQSTQKSAHRISRRAILRGAGCTMALPWLQSLDAFADTPSASAFPKRFGVRVPGVRHQ